MILSTALDSPSPEDPPAHIELRSLEQAADGAGKVVRDPRRLALVLRRLGAVILLASALSFALSGWASLGSFQRYLSFLGFTAALSAAGAFCGLKLKDDKAARTFLGLATAFLPAHFSQLGALLYSHLAPINAYIPHVFRYIGPSLLLTSITIIAASLLLIPIAFAGFSSMARANARLLTAAYVIGNLLLLVPSRESGFVALLGFLMLAALVTLDFLCFHHQLAMRNWDGRATRVMLFGPFAMLVARGMLYPEAELFFSLLCTTAAVVFFVAVPRLFGDRNEAHVSQAVGALLAVPSWMLLTDGIYFSVRSGLLYDLLGSWKSDLFIPINFLGIAAILAVLGSFSMKNGRNFRAWAAWIAIGAMMLQLLAVEGLLSSVLCITVSAGVIAGAFAAEEKAILYAGAVGLALGIIYHLRYALDLYDLSPWLTLAIFGTLTVMASSYIEKNHRKLVSGSRQARERISGWN